MAKNKQGINFSQPEVVLADGTVLKADLGVTGNAMWIWIRDASDPNNSLTALSDLLNREGITQTITRVRNGKSTEYTGYCLLTNVKYYQEGLASARLERGVDDVAH